MPQPPRRLVWPDVGNKLTADTLGREAVPSLIARATLRAVYEATARSVHKQEMIDATCTRMRLERTTTNGFSYSWEVQTISRCCKSCIAAMDAPQHVHDGHGGEIGVPRSSCFFLSVPLRGHTNARPHGVTVAQHCLRRGCWITGVPLFLWNSGASSATNSNSRIFDSARK